MHYQGLAAGAPIFSRLITAIFYHQLPNRKNLTGKLAEWGPIVFLISVCVCSEPFEAVFFILFFFNFFFVMQKAYPHCFNVSEQSARREGAQQCWTVRQCDDGFR